MIITIIISKDPEIEISRMWRVGTRTVLDITGALRTIRKGLDQNPQLPRSNSRSH